MQKVLYFQNVSIALYHTTYIIMVRVKIYYSLRLEEYIVLVFPWFCNFMTIILNPVDTTIRHHNPRCIPSHVYVQGGSNTPYLCPESGPS